MKRILFAMCLFLCVGFVSIHSEAASSSTITMDEIISDAVNCGDCMDWKLLGICFWLKCHLFVCSIQESTKVGHYIQEVVIGTFSANTPFIDMDFYGGNVTGTFSRKESLDDGETFINFKHAEIFGNPALPFFTALAKSSNLFCNPSAKPFEPYFLDKLDPMWSNPLLERVFPHALAGYPQISTNVATGYWAPEYPRCGWGANPIDAINGAVAAQRVAEIATRTKQVHVYTPIPTNGCKGKCWTPGPVQVNKDTANHFQLILPQVQTSASVIGGAASWANGKNKSGQAYVWNLWRYYKCCEKKGSYLSTIDF